VHYLLIMTILALIPGAARAANIWQECQIETVTLCTPDAKGKSAGYYYRCRRDSACDKIDHPWIGRNDKYRAFVVPEANVISRVD